MPANLIDPNQFTADLYLKLQQINPAVVELEFYEFQYALKNLQPAEGWQKIQLQPLQTLQEQIARPEFFANIQLKPKHGDQVILDSTIAS